MILQFMIVRVLIRTFLLIPKNLGYNTNSQGKANFRTIASFLYFVYLLEITEVICPAKDPNDDVIFHEEKDHENKIVSKQCSIGNNTVADQLIPYGPINDYMREDPELKSWVVSER